MRPKIGITAFVVESKDDYPTTGVRRSYLEAISAAGGVPVVIPLIDNKEVISDLLSVCDGLLIPGGEDVSPDRYGEAPHRLLGKVDKGRDELEIFCIHETFKSKKPILGICRGSQILNVAFGGSLYQDISDQRAGQPKHQTGEWHDLVHNLNIVENSQLREILGVEKISVNSLHHQAVKDIGNGLRAIAFSDDGLVEGIECIEHDRFVLGVQCHPEVLWSDVDRRWRGLFERFVKEASNTKPR